jgi:hypothetical protein
MTNYYFDVGDIPVNSEVYVMTLFHRDSSHTCNMGVGICALAIFLKKNRLIQPHSMESS